MNKHKLLSVLLYSFHVGWRKYIPVRNVSYCTLVHNTPEVSLSHVTRTVKTYCVLSFVEVVCWFFIDILRGESVCQVRHQLGLLISEPERNRRKERFLLYPVFAVDWFSICLGEGNCNCNFWFFSTSYPAASWLSFLMFFIQILRSVMAERTLSLKPSLLVLLHKIIHDYLLQPVFTDCGKALTHGWDEIQWLLLGGRSVEASPSHGIPVSH